MCKKNVKISIIVPVYNVERYLPACMDSLVNQTMEDIEIIAVNDGSPDNSLEILNDYQKRYPQKVRVLSIENHGVSYARNYGADHAAGEYLLFVDSDDYVDVQMCETLYRKAAADHNDLVMCGRSNLYESKTENDAVSVNTGMTANQNFTIKEFPFELCWLSPFPWDKLIKKDLFMQVRFPENIRFEDLAYVLKVSCLAENIGVVCQPLYYYRRTTSGGFLNTFSESTLDIIKAFENIMDFMEKKGFAETYRDELAYICARHFFFRYPALFEERRASLKLKREMIRETHGFLDRVFPGWKENHYLKYSSSPAIARNRRLYFSQAKMQAGVIAFRILPQRLWWILSTAAKKIRELIGVLKKPRLKTLVKKFKFLQIVRMPYSYKYTKAYEKYQVDDHLIFLESKHGEDLAGNIFNLLRVLQETEYQDYRVKVALTDDMLKRFHELITAYDFHRAEVVMLRSREYFKCLASAKYLITDTSFPTYFIKKEDQIYLNTWHGTPLKGMGRTVPGREYGQGNVQRNFLISDYLLYQNEFSRDVFLDDYMIRNIYQGNIMLSGYPRNSALFKRDMSEKIRREHNLTGKQLIAYMPTWRGTLQKKDFNEQVKIINQYLSEIDQRLNSGQIFFVKLHPFVGEGIDYTAFRHIRPFIGQYETYDFLNAVDMLVTDYSSIMFDFAVTGKKIILFTYDREEYLKNRGMYLDLNRVEFPTADTVDELIEEIGKENSGYPRFQAEYCCYDSEKTAENVLKTVLGQASLVPCEKLRKKEGKNILIYADGISDRKQFERIIQDINAMAGGNDRYYFCFQANAARKNTTLLQKLDPLVGFIPLSSGIDGLKREYLFRWLYLKTGCRLPVVERNMERLCRRELKKYFGNTQFDKIIYYYGRSLMNLKMLSYMNGEKICNLLDFDKNLYDRKIGYRADINRMVNKNISIDFFCIGEEFTKTQIYQKSKEKVHYHLMEQKDMNIRGLMEGKQ